MRDRDLRALVALVGEGRRDEPGEAMPWSVLEGLRTLIACDRVSFAELDLVGRAVPTQQDLEGDERFVARDYQGPGGRGVLRPSGRAPIRSTPVT